MPAPTHDLFVACLPGLEEILAREAEGLGMELTRPPLVGAGGVVGRADPRSICALNIGLGTASHVLMRVASFRARHLSELRKRAAAVNWGKWFEPGLPVSVRATARRSKLYHSGAIAERVQLGIREQLGRPQGDEPAVEVLARFEDDRCTLSIDSSGRPLHEQGWRLETAKAPLREDIAQAMLLCSDWDPETPFVDPFCGSGTLPILAARRARRIAPGRDRSFAGERLKSLPPARWEEARLIAHEAELPAVSAPIHGSDRDAGAVAISARNAERAGVASDLILDEAPMSAAPGFSLDRPRGVVVSNPPFGMRVGAGADLLPLFQKLGYHLNALSEGWTVVLLSPERRLALRTGLKLQTAFMTNHGGLRVRALRRSAED